MECPVKPEMEQYALTSALWFQAPGPFKCGPKSKFPTTGVSLVSSSLLNCSIARPTYFNHFTRQYWDYDSGKENNEDAYANDRGRVDVEGSFLSDSWLSHN